MIWSKKFDAEQFDNFQKCCRYKEGEAFDAALYNAFKNGGPFGSPDKIMGSQASLSAAMKFVNKAYSAQLHRNCPNFQVGAGDPVWRISACIMNDDSKKQKLAKIIDDAFKMQKCGRLTGENYEKAFKNVCELTCRLFDVTGKKPVSFASKFLHFISQVNPPVDQYSCKGLIAVRRKLNTESKGTIKSKGALNTGNYKTYMRVFYDVLNEFYPKENDAFTCKQVKTLDCYLLHIGVGNFSCPDSCKGKTCKSKNG